MQIKEGRHDVSALYFPSKSEMLAVTNDRFPIPAETELKKRGYSVLRLPPHPLLPTALASHPDMLLFFAPDAVFCTKSYQAIAKKELSAISNVCQKPICAVSAEFGSVYPQDILFNAVSIGQTLICRPDAVAAELATHPNYRLLPVRQGYTKCSVLPVGDHALITADCGIAKAASSTGLDVLLLQPMPIHLDGYDRGFIGGTAGYAPYGVTTTIPFCGSFASCTVEAEQMSQFCRSHGYTLESIGDFEPTDCGTVFLL